MPSKVTNRILYKKCVGVKSILKINLKIFKIISNMIEKTLINGLLNVKKYNKAPKNDAKIKQTLKTPSLK